MADAEPTSAQLAEFQSALVQLLAQDLPVSAMQQRLAEDAAFAAFRAYVQLFEPRMLEVAALLVKKWGKPTDG
jgi:hypothetical protein